MIYLLSMVKHLCKEEYFVLLPEKAMIWEAQNTLILADLHLGKVTHFRKSGMPVPRSAELDNYDRLSFLILNNNIEKVLILGDLFHSRHNSEWDVFKDFLARFPNIQFELVFGNHDILELERYDIPNLTLWGEQLELGPFLFSHEPVESADLYNICGHIHPGIKMFGVGRQSMRLPCFYFAENQAILPAFGAFTGLYCLDVKKEDRVFVIAKDSIIDVG